MRLIETTTLAMQTHYGRDIPPYAILSHTWEDEEVTLQDWNRPTRDSMKGFDKIRMTCQLAASDGIKYAWVDTCCIDKSNSAELSEAINSMYMWYSCAKVCYAYLSDLRLPETAALKGSMKWKLPTYSGDSMDSEGSTDLEGFVYHQDNFMDLALFLRRCRWFSRGWTLQELIAPATVLFYQHDWELVGNKKDWQYMLSYVTGISSLALLYYDPRDFSIAERMSWAVDRQTTREEDIAYCLLGIFNVKMPMLYGEGPNAFRRLQEEIIQTGYDVSIFAWARSTSILRAWHTDHDVFAALPREFESIPKGRIRREWNEVSVTNAGLKLTLELYLVRLPHTDKLSYVLPICDAGPLPERRSYLVDHLSALGIELKKISAGRFIRNNVHQGLVVIPEYGEAGLVRQIHCPGAYILLHASGDEVGDSEYDRSYHPFFAFPAGCKLVRAWPSDSWNDTESTFMMVPEEPNHGSILLEVQSPMLTDDGPAEQCQNGEFMFLFSSLPIHDDTRVGGFKLDLQYTIVGYREHQLKLDIINIRIGAGDMDAGEMRRTLRNFAIPSQQTAAVLPEGTGRYIYTSVEVLETNQFDV